ncbi:hypothetical protein [Chamaesiphon sp.]|uniref:hypothetical protein n=1 Tax=Chamaesiphon sp. TaxID=2814140 RepID=UPI003593DB9A
MKSKLYIGEEILWIDRDYRPSRRLAQFESAIIETDALHIPTPGIIDRSPTHASHTEIPASRKQPHSSRIPILL